MKLIDPITMRQVTNTDERQLVCNAARHQGQLQALNTFGIIESASWCEKLHQKIFLSFGTDAADQFRKGYSEQFNTMRTPRPIR